MMKNYWAKTQQLTEETCCVTSPRQTGWPSPLPENTQWALRECQPGLRVVLGQSSSHLGWGPQGRGHLEAGSPEHPARGHPSLKSRPRWPRLPHGAWQKEMWMLWGGNFLNFIHLYTRACKYSIWHVKITRHTKKWSHEPREKDKINKPTQIRGKEINVDFKVTVLTLLKEGKDELQTVGKELENIRNN